MSVQISPLAESLSAFLKQHNYSAIAVLVDANTKRFCYPAIKNILPKHKIIMIRPGEHFKNLATCEVVWQALTDAEFDRHALVIDLGGGVIGDLGGFCAATYKRGIDFIQIPTTLLSQVDASVGGKLGIDFHGFKNHIGVFKLPEAVLIDTVFFQTLPELELRSGFAEIIKHCLIADAAKWNIIRRRDLNQQNWDDLVPHSVEIKKNIVAQDPNEKGIRKILNFGHTLGHALETHFLADPKRRLMHGEAIAAGMIAEAFIANRKGMIDTGLLEQIEEYLFSIYGRVTIADSDLEPVLMLTLQDKKNRNGQVRMALLDGPGSCAYDVPVTKSEMRRALDYYRT
ncbi:3-dehydroquinate synthase [Larkinella terrae]|uniref:3-dehydroquinate synthase n=1 Tax=Larkinella terrae TaxID=2025311 RepID=A0A7K0EG54_9BACT|nr:3-dehydroquinate synthase [Larkinella terrae]MRS60804.1 3-dehydroquinate synthase [Larkinella terrae]